MSTPPILVRPALGEAASLGTLYDARTDSFLPLSALQTQPPSSAITKTDIHDSDTRYLRNDTLKEKFSGLDVKAQLGASFLAGLVKVEGSGKYLTEERDSNLVAYQTLLHNITTVSERLEFQANEVQNSLSWSTLETGYATHIVFEIVWGSRSVVTAKQSLSAKDNAKAVNGNLSSQLKFWETFGEGKGEVINGDQSLDRSLEVTVFGDVLPSDGLVPTDLASAFRFLTKVPVYIENANSGKGKPLTYKLMPISLLAGVVDRRFSIPLVIHNLETECFEKFVQLFDEITAARQELNDYRTFLGKNRDYVPQDHIRSVGNRISEVRHLETHLKALYAKALHGVRTGAEDKSSLWDLLKDFYSSNSKVQRLADIIFGNYKEKIRFLNDLVDRGAKYVGFNGESLDLELGSNPDIDIYVFHFSETAKLHSELWKQNLAIIYQLLNDSACRIRVVLKDHDAVEERLDVPKIVLIRSAEVIIPDVLQERKLSSGKCFAQYNEVYLDNGCPKPVRRVMMRIPCPKVYCGPATSHDWFCTRCGALIEYGHIDDYLYCDCGRCKYTWWSFRCSNTKHGLEFNTYNSVNLLRLLKGLEPFEELNILILGPTGVGKSTWINSFVNYLSFPSLDDAMNMEELSWKIPFAFNTYSVRDDGEFEKIKVSYGIKNQPTNGPVAQQASIEEVDGTTGESATQNATVHRVLIGECLVRIIDTPGIGDTRGAAQDKKNMADILSVIRGYEKLHGILILLKPNEQRLSIMLRFCIQELLTHLHRDAATNIAFGFTNTRGTSYTPGDTFDPLQTQLNGYGHIDIGLRARNVYCFDSESFRYLAAQKQHEKSLGHLEENRKSWEHSVKESKRLLDHFKSIQPHQVTSTVNLYETRHRIIQMTEPMAAIAEKIKSTIMVNEDHIKDLMHNDLKKKDLEKKLRICVNTLIAVAVDKPRTVCGHADCVEHSNTGLIGTDGRPLLGTVYKTLCHDPCYLDIQVDKMGVSGLQNCWAMNGNGTCRLCSHSWRIHLHIRHEYEDGSTEIDNPVVVEALKRNASDRERKEAAIANKAKLIKDLEFELKMIRDAAAQFSIFLKRNAIMPVNDATLDYLDLQIEQEKGKISEGGSRDKFERLTDFRKLYEQEVKTLTEYMEQGDSQKLLDQAGVEGLMQQLYSLQYYGSQLRQAKQVLDRIGVVTNREKTQVVRANAHFTERGERAIETKKAAAVTVKDIGERRTASNSWTGWTVSTLGTVREAVWPPGFWSMLSKKDSGNVTKGNR
ncbi:hypothetical protein BGW36DRAFT_361457 [Talaromyces proteolyticus]|uniref:G domain-containing protein n=1 Tax=Talaromyces proteolyticus TaxID=1131652 RepID=A0AAD4KKQ7_9EURO|nr:uncharacterized protein BGW36DRAFT_361457 [Talaromyces proteolyticus]KAH8693604.1 hypothetical protein BGW36DRAFT_361457 [Talaromyces proteolyticus]